MCKAVSVLLNSLIERTCINKSKRIGYDMTKEKENPRNKEQRENACE